MVVTVFQCGILYSVGSRTANALFLHTKRAHKGMKTPFVLLITLELLVQQLHRTVLVMKEPCAACAKWGSRGAVAPVTPSVLAGF